MALSQSRDNPAWANDMHTSLFLNKLMSLGAWYVCAFIYLLLLTVQRAKNKSHLEMKWISCLRYSRGVPFERPESPGGNLSAFHRLGWALRIFYPQVTVYQFWKHWFSLISQNQVPERFAPKPLKTGVPSGFIFSCIVLVTHRCTRLYL